MKIIKKNEIEKLRQNIKEFNLKVWTVVENELSTLIKDPEFLNLLLYIPHARRGFGANRPYSCFLGFLFGEGNAENQEIIKVAAALEILNTSITYIDDKIFDDDVNVGNNPSLHKKYGLTNAIITSSSLRCIARRIISELSPKNNLESILRELDYISIEADYGQYLDVKYGNLFEASIKDAIKINDLRTGQFIRRCSEIGYLFSGGSNKLDLEYLHESFKLYGRAVQDINDFDDVNFSEGSPGSHGMDLRLFKKTKPILKALELSNTIQKKKILTVLGNPNAENGAIKNACLAIKKTGALDWSYKDINKTINKAITLIKNRQNPITPIIVDYFSIAKEVMKMRMGRFTTIKNN